MVRAGIHAVRTVLRLYGREDRAVAEKVVTDGTGT